MKSRNLGTLEMEILVEVLTVKPEIVYKALARSRRLLERR